MAERIIPEAKSRSRLLSFIREYREKAGTEPAGSNIEVQFNSNGSFGASSALTFDSSSAALCVGTPDATNGYFQVHNDGGSPLVNIENSANIYPRAMFTVVSGAEGPGHVGVGTSTPAAILHVSSSTTGSVFRLDSTDSDNSSLLYVSASNDIGIAKDAPKIHLDVNHGFLDWLANDTGGGESVTFGTGTTTVGKLYYLHTGSAEWTETNALIQESGSYQMLAIALGTDAATDGMLIRGFYNMDSYLEGTFNVGQQVWIADVQGYASVDKPVASKAVVRQVGHCIPTSKIIYFNPSTFYQQNP